MSFSASAGLGPFVLPLSADTDRFRFSSSARTTVHILLWREAESDVVGCSRVVEAEDSAGPPRPTATATAAAADDDAPNVADLALALAAPSFGPGFPAEERLVERDAFSL